MRAFVPLTVVAATALLASARSIPGANDYKASVQSCKCYACDLSEHASPSNLTIYGRTDGSGATAQQALYAMAWAAQLRLRFGGVVILDQKADEAHGVSRTSIMKFLFGSNIVVNQKPPLMGTLRLDDDAFRLEHYPFLFAIDGVKNGENKNINREELRDLFDANYHRLLSDVLGGAFREYNTPLLNVNFPSEVAPLAFEYSYPLFFNEKFLASIRRGSDCGVAFEMTTSNLFKPSSNESRVIHVAAHLRRGDVETNKVKGRKRITEDNAYIELFTGIRSAIARISPGVMVDMHAFTSCSRALDEVACDKHSEYVQSLYRVHGISVHMDYENSATATKDAIRTWAHFISADVLIVAKSSFSFTPAMFNANCVIYEPHWSKPLSSWVTMNMTWAADKINAAELTQRMAKELPKCLQQLKN